MITYSELDYYVKVAFEKNELFDFILGNKGYDCPYPKSFNIDAPTDIDAVVKSIHKYYEKSNNEEIIVEYEKAITKMINADLYCLWCALYVYWAQMDLENNEKATFEIDKNIGALLKESIIKNEEALKKETIPLKSEYSHYYNDIIRVLNIYKNKWGKNMF